MSILSGLFPASSGTAWVNGHSIQSALPQIHASLGICPQYNILFDHMTVYEHLLFCATLRNVPIKDMEQAISQLLADLHFEAHPSLSSLALL
jgi:ATP-binding cassette subfamily A (ABC1) protein 3